MDVTCGAGGLSQLPAKKDRRHLISLMLIQLSAFRAWYLSSSLVQSLHLRLQSDCSLHHLPSFSHHKGCLRVAFKPRGLPTGLDPPYHSSRIMACDMLETLSRVVIWLFRIQSRYITTYSAD